MQFAIFNPDTPRLPRSESDIPLDVVIGDDIGPVPTLAQVRGAAVDRPRWEEFRALIVEQLGAIVTELYEKHRGDGVGFDDVRIAAQQRNVLTGSEPMRFLSFAPSLMRKHGGVPIGARANKLTGHRVTIYARREYIVAPGERSA